MTKKQLDTFRKAKRRAGLTANHELVINAATDMATGELTGGCSRSCSHCQKRETCAEVPVSDGLAVNEDFIEDEGNEEAENCRKTCANCEHNARPEVCLNCSYQTYRFPCPAWPLTANDVVDGSFATVVQTATGPETTYGGASPRLVKSINDGSLWTGASPRLARSLADLERLCGGYTSMQEDGRNVDPLKREYAEEEEERGRSQDSAPGTAESEEEEEAEVQRRRQRARKARGQFLDDPEMVANGVEVDHPWP
jgi:hypothetical protein